MVTKKFRIKMLLYSILIISIFFSSIASAIPSNNVKEMRNILLVIRKLYWIVNQIQVMLL